MTNPLAPRQRLLSAITETYAAVGGKIDGETLILPDGDISLRGLLRYLELLPVSREFTHLPPLFGPGQGLPMASMYVELAVSRSALLPAPSLLGTSQSLSAALEERNRKQQARRLAVDDALGAGGHRNVVILGEPGGGKTSLLKRATALIAAGAWPAWIVPLYIPLRVYWENRCRFPSAGLTLLNYCARRIINENRKFAGGDYSSVLWFLPDRTPPETNVEIDDIENLLSQLSGPERKHVVFLLDGLDEIASDPVAVETLGEEIRGLGHGFAWVITSRRAGFFGGLEEDVRYEVLSLDNDGIAQLVNNWFSHQDDELLKSAGAQRVLAQVLDNPRLLVMARNPFLLTLLCHLQADDDAADLPLFRSAIYERIFRLAREQLQFREKDSERFGLAELEFLAGFCRYLYTRAPGAPRHLFHRDDWSRYAKPDEPPDLDRHFLESRLLDRWGESDDYHLAHLTLHEYLVARDLAEAPFDEALVQIYRPHWRMVLRFLAGLYRERGRDDDLAHLLRAMLEPLDLNGLRYVEVAQLLLEAGVEDSSALIGRDLRETLWNLWRGKTPYVAEVAGQALAMLAPRLTLERIYGVLDGIAGEIKFFHPPTPESISGELAIRAVRLLAEIPSGEAVALLLELLVDEHRPQLADAAIQALILRNWPAVRRDVLAVAANVEQGGFAFIRICQLAGFTRHRDFAPWLQACLTATEIPSTDLLAACALVGGHELGEALLPRIQAHPEWADSWTAETWDSLADTSEAWCVWIRDKAVTANGAVVLQAAALRNRLVDEAAILALFKRAADDEALALLLEAVGDGALANRPTSHAVEQALIGYLTGPDQVRSAAVFSLSLLDEQRQARGVARRYTARFRALLDDPDEDVRDTVVSSLGNSGDSAMCQPIREITADPAQPLRVRCAAIEALGRLPDDHAGTNAALLEQWLEEPGPDIALEAALALARIQPARLGRHLGLARVRAALAQIGAERGMLFFDKFFVDAGGERHEWMDVEVGADDSNLVEEPVNGKLSEKPVEVFISYTHDDDELKNELIKHLSTMKRNGEIQVWHGRMIAAGREWEGQVDEHLETADLILLLISASFIASDYCWDIELRRAMERHENGTARVVPLILRETDLINVPFAKLQSLPTDRKPVTDPNSWCSHDAAWVNVVDGLRKAISEITR